MSINKVYGSREDEMWGGISQVAPENAHGDCLKVLTRVSRLFKDANFRSCFMVAKTTHEALAAKDAD